MTRPRILFRADASHAVGFGHVARLCALIEEVEARGADAVPLFGGDAAAVQSWCRDRGITPQFGLWSPTDVLHAVEDPRVVGIVIDGSPLIQELVPKLADRDTRIIIVDDSGRCEAKVDTIVNHNFHAPGLHYGSARNCLLGRRYLMLRRDIRRYTRGSCRPMPSPRLRVVISFGGSDPVRATIRTLHVLPPAEERPLELVVIAGPGYRDDEALRDAAAVATKAGHTVDVRRAPEDPGALFVSADAAICSAGGTLGELAYLGCPAAAYAIVPDQITPARHQVREGLIFGGRTWSEVDDSTLRSELLCFLLDDKGRREQRQRALATADGDGVRRIVDEALA